MLRQFLHAMLVKELTEAELIAYRTNKQSYREYTKNTLTNMVAEYDQ